MMDSTISNQIQSQSNTTSSDEVPPSTESSPVALYAEIGAPDYELMSDETLEGLAGSARFGGNSFTMIAGTTPAEWIGFTLEVIGLCAVIVTWKWSSWRFRK